MFKPDTNANGLLASLKVSWILAKAKNTYSDVDIIKDACKTIIQSIGNGPELKLLPKLDAVPLSAETATRRVSSCVSID